MDLKKIKETDIWTLYEQGRNYCRLINMYTDTDRNYRMYNGNQWEGLKISGIEPVQLNFIKSIVKYKVGVLNQNLWAVNYSSENFETKEFRKTADKTCKLLNKKASKIWEKDNLDHKLRKVCKDSAINDEGIIYVNYDSETNTPINEIISKNDIYYGNENCSEIQKQPYIIIKQRLSVLEVRRIAEEEGVSKEEIELIVGDKDNFEEAGEQAKYEKDDLCTLLTKMYKEDGTVHFSKATRYCDIKEDTDSGLTYYPVEHMLWEEKEGSARGEGEVRHLIPNQIEVNKTIMRRLISAKQTAYPQKIVNIDKIVNPSAVNEIGGVIKVQGLEAEDVKKFMSITQPAQMSTDAEKVQNELITITRDLAGAGDSATGDTDPEQASGKAILAVQQASQQPLVEQLSSLKSLFESLARIWLDMITVYSKDGIELEDTETDEMSGEEVTKMVKVPQSVLQQLQATVKVDITPKGAFDKYAQEVSLENLLKAGYFNVDKLNELEIYVNTLDDDSVMPKQKLQEAIDSMREKQRRIAEINAQAQMVQQRARQFIDGDINTQARQIMQASQPVQQAQTTNEAQTQANV